MLLAVTVAQPRAREVVDASTLTAPLAGHEGPLHRGAMVGRYLVLDQIGAGGMGIVYRAYDPELDRKVALKVVRGDEDRTSATVARARLAREAQTLARLCHPNVVRVYDVGLHRAPADDPDAAAAPSGAPDGLLFVAMELIDGMNLSQWLQADPTPRGVRDIVKAFVQAGTGLAAAHDVGVVHRDFKPSNVLIASDGRVCVTDFGLARANATTEIPLRSRPEETTTDMDLSLADADSESLTERGRVVGTPGYMAPEQHMRAHPDPRADQYSFCVALFEALYGRRPFSGLAGRALALAKRRGPEGIDFRRGRIAVPRWLRRVLVRGLQAAPFDRHRHMQDLIDALRRGLEQGSWRGTRTERGLLLAAAATATVGAVAWAGLWVGFDDRCAHSSPELVGVWDDAARARVAKAFENGGGSPAAFATVVESLDDYTHRWASLHREACHDTWIRGQQSPQALDQRMACLHRRLESVGATVDLLAEGDPSLVRRAPEMTAALPLLEPCSTAATAPLDVPRPADEALAQRYDAARRRLAVAEAQMAAGRFERANAAVEQLRIDLDPWADDALRSEILLVRGRLLDDRGHHVESAEQLGDVARLARSVGHRRVEAEAWLRLARVHGVRLQDEASASFSADMAEATIRALGEPADFSAALSFTRGRIAFVAGRDEEARAHFEQALAKRRKHYSDDDYRLAEILSWLAGLQQRQGDFETAESNLRRVIDIHTRAFGTEHPRVASATGNLGLVLAQMGRTDEALASMRRGRSIFVTVFGPRHPAVAVADDSIGDLLRRSGRADEAAASFRRALATFEEVGVPGPQRVGALLGLAQVELERAHPLAALEHLDRARDFAQDTAINPVILGDIELAIGGALVALGQPTLSCPHLDQAEALFIPTLAPNDDRYATLRDLQPHCTDSRPH